MSDYAVVICLGSAAGMAVGGTLAAESVGVRVFGWTVVGIAVSTLLAVLRWGTR